VAERTIPRGYVSSYSALAACIGRPRAARAVGTALAGNPFPIIIPCHRTVRTDGSLGGFGGGLPMKRALLEMEGVTFDQRGRARTEFFWELSAGSTT
jgi:methylated-DNA-[protein]-cysteine S-methyltransferase